MEKTTEILLYQCRDGAYEARVFMQGAYRFLCGDTIEQTLWAVAVFLEVAKGKEQDGDE